MDDNKVANFEKVVQILENIEMNSSEKEVLASLGNMFGKPEDRPKKENIKAEVGDCDQIEKKFKAVSKRNEIIDCYNCTAHGSGWLFDLDYNDFAGSGIVHVLGGTCALVACYMIGPRKGRFSEEGNPNKMSGHSVPLAALGGFILIFGFLAFNAGSQVHC